MLQWRACARFRASAVTAANLVLRDRCIGRAINGRMGEITHTARHIGRQLHLSALGGGALAANKVRYSIGGYRSPRPYGNDRIDAVVDYSFATVDKMRSWASSADVRGRRILELGPGDNLCVGLILLGLGARSYDAVDINPLAAGEHHALYGRLFERMAEEGLSVVRAKSALRQLNRGPLRYHVLDDFDLRRLAGHTFDHVWSQAAFEHFTDPVRTIGQLDSLLAPTAELGVEIDLMTHTRALRIQDPLNIYRVPEGLYRALRFAGIPNRYRTAQYRDAFEASGWRNVTVERVASVPLAELERVGPWLAAPFRGDDNDMADLVVVIRARRERPATVLEMVA